MLRIKSAQFKAMINPVQCKSCKQIKDDDNLFQGYCEDCFTSGTIKPCPNCDRYFQEDEGIEGYCPDCGGDFFQFDKYNRLVDIRER